MRERLQHYIDGKWVDSEGGVRREVINPATEEAVSVITVGTKADVDKAVAAARRAFKTWSKTTREERLAVLNRIVEEYKKRAGDLAVSMAEEMGAPVSFAGTAQVGAGIGGFLGTIAALQDFDFTEKQGGYTVAYEPIGVVGMITPWNWPLNQIALKVAPALAAGDTMVLKPSEECPTNAAIFAEILDAAGVPPGVFNLVQGDGPTTGNAISSHPDVEMVSFTGSTRAGIAVAIAAAPTVKRVHQELGGKSPNLVLPDADFAATLPHTLSGPLVNTGQSCISPTKVLVPRERMGEAEQFANPCKHAVQLGWRGVLRRQLPSHCPQFGHGRLFPIGEFAQRSHGHLAVHKVDQIFAAPLHLIDAQGLQNPRSSVREMRCFTLVALPEFRLCCPLTCHVVRNLPEFRFHVEP